MRSGKIVQAFSEMKAYIRFHDFISVHSIGVRADNPQNFDCS